MNRKLALILFSIFLIVLVSFSYVLASGDFIRSKGVGGASVPIYKIDLSSEKNNYEMKLGRLVFEFEDKPYAIQVRRIKDAYVEINVLDLESKNLGNVTAYNLKDSFDISVEGVEKIDLNGDGIYEIQLELNDINLKDRSVGFSIQIIGND